MIESTMLEASPLPPASGSQEADAVLDKDPDNPNADDDVDSIPDDSRSRLENLKYYVSLVLGTLCIVCIFAFLFLVPFVLDPAISTLMHKFVEHPVVCKVNSIAVKTGKSNCTWSSCREGCTADMFKCFQVRVLYAPEKPWQNDTEPLTVAEVDSYGIWLDMTRFDEKEGRIMMDTPLLVNIKGCGYPPEVDCAAFAIKYQNYSEAGVTFPCYYSQLNPWMVMESYHYDETLNDVLASIAIPNGLFVSALGLLLYWYCPYCRARYKRYEAQSNGIMDAAKKK